MKKLSINKFMEDMLNVASPSGFEEKATKIWKEYLKDLIIKEDTYGNCVAMTNDKNENTIMLCSHIDEVGFMVSYINDDGYIYVSTIGGVDPAIVSGQRVFIYGSNNPQPLHHPSPIPGVFGRLAIHMLNRDEESTPEISDLYIDIGASSKEEAEKFVSIGDPVIFDVKCAKLIGNTITGKSLDDRLGAYCVAETLKSVSAMSTPTVCGVASIQEENGGYGAEMATFNIKPKMAIVIDVCHATDTPDASKEKHGDIGLGYGPVLSIGSSCNKKLNHALLNIAKKNKIPYQVEANSRYTGTDADVIFKMLGGIPTTVVSIPLRYMHTPVEVGDLDDITNTIKLLIAFCREDLYGIL